MGDCEKRLSGARRTNAEHEIMPRQLVEVSPLCFRFRRYGSPSPDRQGGAGNRRWAAQGLADRRAHIDLSDVKPLSRPFRDDFGRTSGAGATGGISGETHPAARRLNHHVKGVLDKRRMSTLGSRHGPNPLLLQRQKIFAHRFQSAAPWSVTNAPVRLFGPTPVMRTFANWPISCAGASAQTACSQGLRPINWPS